MWTKLYCVAVAVRFVCAVLPGYGHPDEVFQGVEVVMGDVLAVHHVRPWEFGGTPLRSMLPMYVCRGRRAVVVARERLGAHERE